MANRPIPSHLKLILGNPGRRPTPSAEDLPPVSVPPCPKHLDRIAKAEWKRIVPELQALNLLHRADMAQLAAYCVAYSRWVNAENAILAMQRKGGTAVHGWFNKSPNGYLQISPLMVVANKAMEQVRAFAGEFGLSPVMRSRVEAVSLQRRRAIADGDPMESLLNNSKD